MAAFREEGRQVMLTQIDQFFEQVNLIPIHATACMAGCFLSLAVMQISGHHDQEFGDSRCVSYLRRFSLCSLGLTLLWAASYSATKGWQPWLPDVAVIITIDIFLIVRTATVLVRWKRLVAMKSYIRSLGGHAQ
jgi:hypothetical protein